MILFLLESELSPEDRAKLPSVRAEIQALETERLKKPSAAVRAPVGAAKILRRLGRD